MFWDKFIYEIPNHPNEKKKASVLPDNVVKRYSLNPILDRVEIIYD